MVIHHREAGEGDGEELSQFLESVLEPRLAVERLLAEQEGPPDAASSAVIPTGYGGVDEVGTSDCHQCISDVDARILTI